jgi:hypothetical protein
MTRDEPPSHSFIITIWLAEPPAQGDRAAWRGTITHVGTAERGLLHELDGISGFIAPYLEPVRLRPRPFPLRWLQRLRRRQRGQNG